MDLDTAKYEKIIIPIYTIDTGFTTYIKTCANII